MIAAGPPLSEMQRRLLDEIGDVLIPRGPTLPSASEAAFGHELIDLLLHARPDLREFVDDLLDSVTSGAVEPYVWNLQNADPTRFDSMCFVVAGAYFMSDVVRAALGYPGQQEKPFEPYWYISLVEDGLLDPVVGRGPVYRPTPVARRV